ncbi:ESPR domain-containing protein, partial [Glaesserella parasuis]|nr:ESPR domain-containing protein [Glaesserella parasuis]
MNKIFRVIWNHTSQTWVAVSELAKGKVKSSNGERSGVEINRSHPQWWGASATVISGLFVSNMAWADSANGLGQVSQAANTDILSYITEGNPGLDEVVRGNRATTYVVHFSTYTPSNSSSRNSSDQPAAV